MPQRPNRRSRTELVVELAGRTVRLGLPRVDVREIATGANPPLPGSGTGGTGTPRKSFRCPSDLWGAALSRAHAKRPDPDNWNGVLRGYVAAYVRGEAVIYPDPMDGEDDENTAP